MALFFFFQAEDGIRDLYVTGVQTCALPISAHPRQRLKAVKELVDAGVKASVGMAPILPGISDRPEQLREVVRAAREAGATGIWANLLFLRPGTREHFLAHLAEDWPEQLPLYEQLYAGKAYLGAQ